MPPDLLIQALREPMVTLFVALSLSYEKFCTIERSLINHLVQFMNAKLAKPFIKMTGASMI